MKPYKTDRAELGDIIMSEKFAYRQRDIWNKKKIWIGGNKKTAIYTPSRAEAHYVVELAIMKGDGTVINDGHSIGPYEEWYVEARKLDKDDIYNPKNEMIAYHSRLEVYVVGKMERTFVKKEELADKVR